MSSVKWSDLPDNTPVEYEQENQKRPGSKSHDLYERYKKSKTYGEAKANGARPEDFRHDYGKGWLKLQPAGGQIPLVPSKNGAKKESEGSKRPSKDGGLKKSKEEDEPIWQEETRDPEQIQQDLKKQEQLSKELNELKNDQYKKRERPKDAFDMAMEAFSKGSSTSSKPVKVPEAQAAPFDVKLEKAHKQLQKETFENFEKNRKEKAEKAKLEAEKAAREAREAKEAKAKEVKVDKSEKSSKVAKTPEKMPEKPEKGSKIGADKAEAKAEKKEKAEAKSEKADKVKHEKSDKEKKLKKDKKEKKHKKDKKHKKHKNREHRKSETKGTKKTPRLSAARIRELLRSKVIGKDKFKAKEKGYQFKKDESGLYIRLDTRRKRGFNSEYLGVTPAPTQNKDARTAWRARFNGNILGTFETQEEAAQVYAKARGEYEAKNNKNGGQVAGGQSNGVKRPSPVPQEKDASPKDKVADSLQETVELLQKQINELKPQQLDKLMEYFKADITWRADDAEDFNFDLKTYSVPRLRELTRLIRQVRSEEAPAQAANPVDATERLRLQQSKPVSQSAQLAAAIKAPQERELQDKIRELEQRNQNQQRQIEEQKAQMMQMQAVQAHVQVQAQDPRFPPGQNTFGGSSSSARPNGAWKVPQAPEPATQGLHASHAPSLHALPPGGRWPAGYIGDGGGWVPGGEPPKNAQPPAVPPGDTEPPGRCVESCRCGQVVSRAWEVEKPWLKDEARAMAIMAAIHRFESQPSVERRGKVSKQNRYEPAAPAQQALAAEVAGRVPLPAHLRMRAP